jgi:hypothetical protein
MEPPSMGLISDTIHRHATSQSQNPYKPRKQWCKNDLAEADMGTDI